MSEVKLLELPEIARYSVCGDIAYPVSDDPDGGYVDYDDHVAAMHAYARANLAEREREVEALRALFEEVDELLCTHPQAASYPDGPCIEREMRECLIAARDKARAALEQEDARG